LGLAVSRAEEALLPPREERERLSCWKREEFSMSWRISSLLMERALVF
jgi:hypothetical protein